MRRLVQILSLLAISACTSGSGSPHDVVGPFEGPTTRFAIDHFTLPTTSDMARKLGDDLNGDGASDNQIGAVLASLSGQGDATTHGDDLIGAGRITSSIELQAPDLDDAARAGATYLGADGDAATPVGGTIVDGVFASNRTLTTHAPGEATLVLPVFADADPTTVELDAMELDLSPDGSGGYDAVVHGGIAPDRALAATATGMAQMIANHLADHVILARLFDTDRDGHVTPDEVSHAPLMQSLLAPDVTLFGQGMVSTGFAAHLVPCPAGGCASPPADTCFDRLRDGDETDVDCGGSCQPCAAGATCAVAADCQLGACDAGACAGPTCNDGRLDGLESDVDCGWNCGPCASGQKCLDDTDCASGHCDSSGCR